MYTLLTKELMKKADALTISDHHIPALVLMERASLCFVDTLLAECPKAGSFLVVCGSGNNGGDGLCIARLLHLKGFAVRPVMIGNPDSMTAETRNQYDTAVSYGLKVETELGEDCTGFDVVIDAIFGVGLSRNVEGRYAEIIGRMNSLPGFKAAVDIPSGIDGDTGKVLGTAFLADLTVTFAYKKPGLLLYPGRNAAGKLVVADIGIYCSEEASPWHSMGKEDLALLPERERNGNKATFGKVLIVAGSRGMCGAAYLSAKAALSMGCGMVMIATPEENRVPLQTMLPEAIVECGGDAQTLEKSYNWCDVLVLGPGLGTSDYGTRTAEWFLKRNTQERKPMVLDADGLNLLAAHPEWKTYLGSHILITPHPGEMARLVQRPAAAVTEDPCGTAAGWAKENGALCVLKGGCSVVTDGNAFYLNESGNDGMATAGSGDVLSGILGGLFACKGISLESSALGVYIHGLCGDLAAAEYGKRFMKAGHLIDMLAGVEKQCQM
ncbi:MAG: NAD(P)H-hydrate dehydratase [Blautia sp.]|nr:NAD(P)H-hydrate dehydratase [Blautia sp.]